MDRIRQKIMTILSWAIPREQLIFGVLTLLAGVFIFSFRCDYQNYVSQGDHGRDLYAFKVVAENGAVPYRDFSWLFGPLMVYFYAAVFKVFGATVQSALVAQNVLIVLTGVTLYLVGKRLLSPALACVCALWYWAFRGSEFFHTYNHIGGLLCMVFMALMLFSYVDKARIRYVAGGLLAALFLLLIRPNMGAVFLAGWISCLLWADRGRDPREQHVPWRVPIYGAIACIMLGIAVYYAYFRGMPDYIVWESFPFLKEQRTDGAPGIFYALVDLWRICVALFLSSGKWKLVATILAACCLSILVRLYQHRGADRRIIFRAGVLMLLALAAMHEYLISSISYRLYWALPFILMLGFLIFHEATSQRSLRYVRWVVIAGLLGMALLTIWGATRLIRVQRTADHLLQQGGTRIYTLQDPQWHVDLRATCDFIEKNISPDEPLFTLPFDTLYNFLTARRQPTRQWTYFKHFIIPEEQERSVMDDLERGKVRWVLISNRAVATSYGLGVFGREHCQLLGQYIFTHYTPVARFGPWDAAESWTLEHGVVFLKRKTPFRGE